MKHIITILVLTLLTPELGHGQIIDTSTSKSDSALVTPKSSTDKTRDQEEEKAIADSIEYAYMIMDSLDAAEAALESYQAYPTTATEFQSLLYKTKKKIAQQKYYELSLYLKKMELDKLTEQQLLDSLKYINERFMFINTHFEQFQYSPTKKFGTRENDSIEKAIDPTHFISIYESRPNKGMYRLIKNYDLQYYSTINSDSKISIDFDIAAIAYETKFFGSLTLVGRLNDREVEVSPYSLVGKDYTPIGTSSGFSTYDFASSLVGVLAQADKVSRTKEYPTQYNATQSYFDPDNSEELNDPYEFNEDYFFDTKQYDPVYDLNKLLQAQETRQYFHTLSSSSDTIYYSYENWPDPGLKTFIKTKLEIGWNTYQLIESKHGQITIKKIPLLKKIFEEGRDKLTTEQTRLNEVITELNKKRSKQNHLYRSIYLETYRNRNSKVSDSIEKVLKTINEIIITQTDSISLLTKQIKNLQSSIQLTNNQLDVLNEKNLIPNLSDVSLRNYFISGKIGKDLLIVYYNKYYDNSLTDGSIFKNINNLKASSQNEARDPIRDVLKSFRDDVRIKFGEYKIFANYFNYLENMEKEASALSSALQKSPVLIASIINNLKISVNEIETALNNIDSLIKLDDLSKCLRGAINTIENYQYHELRLKETIKELDLINAGYVVKIIENYRSKYYLFNDEITVYYPDRSIVREGLAIDSKPIILFNGEKTPLHELLNRNIHNFTSYLIDEISYQTGLVLYQGLKSGVINLQKEAPKDGDLLHIDLIWNRFDTKSNLKPVRIPVASFKTKATGWKSKIYDSFFLIYHLNPDQNNPDLVKSVFSGSAGVSYIYGYNSDRSPFTGYKPLTRQQSRFEAKNKSTGKSILNAIEPSFGINVSYLNFNNRESFEIGTGLVIGLFNNTILSTVGYNLNMAPGMNGMYFGVGFSFVDLANKFNPK